MTPDRHRPGRRLPRRYRFPAHLAVFAAAVPLLLVAETLSGSTWNLFWPLAAWTVLVTLHYFVASAYDLDNAWVDDRVTDLRARSYDFDHIQNIEQRVREHDASVTPPIEKRRAPKDR